MCAQVGETFMTLLARDQQNVGHQKQRLPCFYLQAVDLSGFALGKSFIIRNNLFRLNSSQRAANVVISLGINT